MKNTKGGRYIIEEYTKALEYVFKERGASDETLKKCRGKDAIIVLGRQTAKTNPRMIYLQALLRLRLSHPEFFTKNGELKYV